MLLTGHQPYQAAAASAAAAAGNHQGPTANGILHHASHSAAQIQQPPASSSRLATTISRAQPHDPRLAPHSGLQHVPAAQQQAAVLHHDSQGWQLQDAIIDNASSVPYTASLGAAAALDADTVPKSRSALQPQAVTQSESSLPSDHKLQPGTVPAFRNQHAGTTAMLGAASDTATQEDMIDMQAPKRQALPVAASDQLQAAAAHQAQLPLQASDPVMSGDARSSQQPDRSQSDSVQGKWQRFPTLVEGSGGANVDVTMASTGYAAAPAGPSEHLCPDVVEMQADASPPSPDTAVVPKAVALQTKSVVRVNDGQLHAGCSELATNHHQTATSQQTAPVMSPAYIVASGDDYRNHIIRPQSLGLHARQDDVACTASMATTKQVKLYNETVVGDVQKVLDAALWGAGRPQKADEDGMSAQQNMCQEPDGASAGQKRQLSQLDPALDHSLPVKRCHV